MKISSFETAKVSKFLYTAMILIFVTIICTAAWCGVAQMRIAGRSVLVYAALLTAASVFISQKGSNFINTSEDTENIIILSVICFAAKFLWVYFMRIEPQVDYKTFYDTAVDLSKNRCVNSRYVALFSHIMGYSSFLSVFIALFGENPFVASVLNVILSVVSGILIYKITKTLASTFSAAASYILWIVCPSQTIYNNLVLSEPLYTTYILAFVYLVVLLRNRENSLTSVYILGYGAVMGLILRCINVCRPVAAIFVIAIFIWLFLLRTCEWKNRKFAEKYALLLVSMLTVYYISGSLWNIYFTARIGEKPALVPGYNVYVGFNTESSGGYNEHDAEILCIVDGYENITAEDTQNEMLKIAKERIQNENINFLNLFKQKMGLFLGTDTMCVEYNKEIISNISLTKKICESFYYCLLFLNVGSVWRMLKPAPHSAAFILPLYVIGITLAQMAVEVAGRYHYSVIPFLIMIPTIASTAKTRR